MKRIKAVGHSARRGNMPAPYTKSNKKPFHYDFQEKEGIVRLASGDLKNKANDKSTNQYA